MTNQDYAATAKRFHDRLDALQFPDSTESGRCLLVEESPDDMLSLPGLVNRRMLCVQLAYILERALVLKPVAEDTCGDCYLPQTALDWRDFAGIHPPAASFDVQQFAPVVRLDFADFWANERLRRYFFPWAPPDFAAFKCPRLLFDGESLNRLPLTAEAQALADEAKSSVCFDELVIGLHAGRTTDPNATPHVALDDLLAQVRAVADQSNAQRVLVTGDEENGTVHALRDCGLQPVIATLPTDQALHDLIELELLSSCDWVVGRAADDAPRLAAARIGLRTFRCDRHRLVAAQSQHRGLRRLFPRRA